MWVPVGLISLRCGRGIRKGSAGRALDRWHSAKKPSPQSWWHLQVPRAKSFWRRWWLILGEGRKLRATLTHGFARLIAGRCRRFITATRGSLHLASRCVSPLAEAAGCPACRCCRGRGEEEPPAPFSVRVHRGCGGAASRSDGEATVNYLLSAHPGDSPIHRLGCPGVQRVPDLLLGRVMSSSSSVHCALKASVLWVGLLLPLSASFFEPCYLSVRPTMESR